MSYTHRTNHSFTPNTEFWRSLENFLNAFPYRQGKTGYIPSDELIVNFYERRFKEKFDVENNENDIYGNPITRKYIWNISGRQRLYLDEMDEDERRGIEARQINKELNPMGKVIKFLSNSISNPDMVYKFQHFFESIYYFLEQIIDLNPNLSLISSHGLNDKSNPRYEERKNDFLNKNGGIMDLKEFLDKFNDICRNHGVPFVMHTFYDECYVVHSTDIFTEKAILDLPIFLSHSDLRPANELFVEAYRKRKAGNDKDCLAKIREGLEAIRDYIYAKFPSLPAPTISPHNDFKLLFDNHSSVVFDYNKIPEDDPRKLQIITGYLRDTVLLAIKFGNFGHHMLNNPSLLEENTSNFALVLIASVLPYIFHILK